MKLKKRIVAIAAALTMTLCLAVPVGAETTGNQAVAESYQNYAATGDSITVGFGLDGETPWKISALDCVDGCYPQIVSGHIGAHLDNLARTGMTPGEYYTMLNNKEEYATDIEALQSADLITVNFGQVNVIDNVLWDHLVGGMEDILRIPDSERDKFQTDLAKAISSGTDPEEAIEQIANDINFKSEADRENFRVYATAVIEVIATIKEDISVYLEGGYDKLYKNIRADLIKKGISEKDMKKFEALFSKKNLGNAYDKAYADYTAQIGKCINKIKSVNENKAQYLAVGYYDPAQMVLLMDGVRLKISLSDGVTLLGAPFSNAATLSKTYTAKMNSYLKGLTDADMAYVDISGIPQASFKYTFHPSPEGHEYIAEQVEDVLENGLKTVPVTVKLKTASKGVKKFTAKWAKAGKTDQAQITGYRVQYSTKKDFSTNVKNKTVAKKTATSLTVSGLKKKTTYYYRVCCYEKNDGRMFYSDWTATKSIKTK